MAGNSYRLKTFMTENDVDPKTYIKTMMLILKSSATRKHRKLTPNFLIGASALTTYQRALERSKDMWYHADESSIGLTYRSVSDEFYKDLFIGESLVGETMFAGRYKDPEYGIDQAVLSVINDIPPVWFVLHPVYDDSLPNGEGSEIQAIREAAESSPRDIGQLRYMCFRARASAAADQAYKWDAEAPERVMVMVSELPVLWDVVTTRVLDLYRTRRNGTRPAKLKHFKGGAGPGDSLRSGFREMITQ